MTHEQAKAILQFLSRVQINGAEAPVFMECVMALRLIAAPAAEATKITAQDEITE